MVNCDITAAFSLDDSVQRGNGLKAIIPHFVPKFSSQQPDSADVTAIPFTLYVQVTTALLCGASAATLCTSSASLNGLRVSRTPGRSVPSAGRYGNSDNEKC
jgi:hypothetical protein